MRRPEPRIEKRFPDLLSQQICKLLWEEWDPIGVNSNQLLNDEYDSCVPSVRQLLLEDADIAEVAEHLAGLELEGTPVEEHSAVRIAVAAKLVGLRARPPSR